MANDKNFVVKKGLSAGSVSLSQAQEATSGLEGYRIDKLVDAGLSLDVTAQGVNPYDIDFNTDGTIAYVTQNSLVAQYTLSTAWDISTGTYDSKTIAADSFYAGRIKPDGTKFFTVSGGSTVKEYDLSTAWDISTATYSESFSVSTQVTDAKALFFTADGTKMLVANGNAGSVWRYSLSTAWDITTASYASQTEAIYLLGAASGTRMVHYAFDGERLIVGGRLIMSDYVLSPAFQVNKASLLNYVQSNSNSSNNNGGNFSSDGKYLYRCSYSDETIYQYETYINTRTLDLSESAHHYFTPTEDVKVIFSNVPTTPSAFTLHIKGNTVNGFKVEWPDIIEWEKGYIPYEGYKSDTVYAFFSVDGETIYGKVVAKEATRQW